MTDACSRDGSECTTPGLADCVPHHITMHTHSCRRSEQMMQTGGDELEAVKSYFDTTGFERWNKIYGDTDEVNKVRAPIVAECLLDSRVGRLGDGTGDLRCHLTSCRMQLRLWSACNFLLAHCKW